MIYVVSGLLKLTSLKLVLLRSTLRIPIFSLENVTFVKIVNDFVTSFLSLTSIEAEFRIEGPLETTLPHISRVLYRSGTEFNKNERQFFNCMFTHLLCFKTIRKKFYHFWIFYYHSNTCILRVNVVWTIFAINYFI